MFEHVLKEVTSQRACHPAGVLLVTMVTRQRPAGCVHGAVAVGGALCSRSVTR